MNRILQFIGSITIGVGLFYVIITLKSSSRLFNETLRVFGLISLICIILYIVAKLIWGRNWFLKGTGNFFIGSNLIEAINLFLKELPNPSKESIAILGGHIIYRFTRLGVMGLMLAFIPIALLWQQNQKIEEQTKLFELQNKKIDAQIELDESSRRGNLVVMMSNVLDKVDEELQRDSNSKELSTQLVGRIAALSQAFRPYRFWQNSSLTKKPLSPERGQLLMALVNSNLSKKSYRAIYKRSTFKSAYLEGANLMDADLEGAYLWNADLTNANLINANLKNVNLIGGTLQGADLSGAHLNDAQLSHANLSHGFYTKAVLRNANLSEANLSNSRFRNTDLGETHLKKANLVNTNIKGAILWKAFVDSIQVNDAEWLIKLEEWSVVGWNELNKEYFIVSTPNKNDEYIIKKQIESQ